MTITGVMEYFSKSKVSSVFAETEDGLVLTDFSFLLPPFITGVLAQDTPICEDYSNVKSL